MSERHALLRPLQRCLKRSLSNADSLRCNADAAAVERRKRHPVAFALVANAVANGHHAIREDKLAASGRIDSEFLFFLAYLESRPAFLHDDGGNSFFSL